jgi:HD-like signal output (HDOD) protein
MALSRTSVLRRVRTFSQLPTLPEVMQQILETVDSEDSSAQDLSRILEADPVITARVLRLANSSFYGCRQRVDSLQRAVVMVGFATVKQLALATTVLNFLQRAQQRVLEPQDFWLHSFGAAKAAQLLALATHHAQAAPLCFTAALLHDVGKYVLALSLGEEYQQQATSAMEQEMRLCDVERRTMGVDHAEVGAMLLEQWGLPPLICTALAYQYTPEQYAGPRQLEVAIVAVSSEVSRLAGFGNAGDVGPLRLPAISLSASGLTAEAISAVIQELPQHRDEACDLLQLFQETPGP